MSAVVQSVRRMMRNYPSVPVREQNRSRRLVGLDGNPPSQHNHLLIKAINMVTPSRLQPELRPSLQHCGPHPFLRRLLSLQSPTPLAFSRSRFPEFRQII